MVAIRIGMGVKTGAVPGESADRVKKTKTNRAVDTEDTEKGLHSFSIRRGERETVENDLLTAFCKFGVGRLEFSIASNAILRIGSRNDFFPGISVSVTGKKVIATKMHYRSGKGPEPGNEIIERAKRRDMVGVGADESHKHRISVKGFDKSVDIAEFEIGHDDKSPENLSLIGSRTAGMGIKRREKFAGRVRVYADKALVGPHEIPIPAGAFTLG